MFVNFSVMPLRISTLTGFILSAFGALGGAIVVERRCFGRHRRAWASPMAAVLLLSGVQLLDPQDRRRISGPTLPDRQSETPIRGERSAPQATEHCEAERASPAWLSQSA